MAENEPRKILENRVGLAEHKRNVWFATAEAGTEIEEVLHREYWTHLARQLRPYDEIIVAVDTNDWLVRLMVHSSGPGWANVIELERHTDLVPKFMTAVEDTGNGLMVQWSGPHTKWRVMRMSDKQVLKDGFADRHQAELFLQSFDGVKVA